MHFRRWVLALVITLMLIDSWVKSAEATSTEPDQVTSGIACVALRLARPAR